MFLHLSLQPERQSKQLKNPFLSNRNLLNQSMNSVSIKFSTVILLIFSAALSRILPHPFNFTPIGAIALFGAAHFDKKYFAFLIPIMAMLVSDSIIGFHSSMAVVYGTFAFITLIGIFFLNKVTFGRVLGLSILSSTLFFITTNFAVWYGSTFYSQSWQGLLTCYSAGLAFYQNSFFGNLFLNTIMGDLFYCGLLFGLYEGLQRFVPKLRFA